MSFFKCKAAIILSKLSKKGMCSTTGQENQKNGWQDKRWSIGGSTRPNSLFGILILMLLARRHGMTSHLQGNINSIVIMNRKPIRVKGYTDSKIRYARSV